MSFINKINNIPKQTTVILEPLTVIPTIEQQIFNPQKFNEYSSITTGAVPTLLKLFKGE